MMKTLGLILFIIFTLPFHTKMLNFQNIMNESLTGVAFAMSYVFTQNLSEEDQYLHSYIILGIVAIILAFNIVLVIIDTLESLYEVY